HLPVSYRQVPVLEHARPCFTRRSGGRPRGPGRCFTAGRTLGSSSCSRFCDCLILACTLVCGFFPRGGLLRALVLLSGSRLCHVLSSITKSGRPDGGRKPIIHNRGCESCASTVDDGPSPAEHVVEHRLSEFTREGVLLARMK